MRPIAAALLLASCFRPPHLASMTTETGKGGIIDYDYSDRERAEGMAADFCGGSFRPAAVEAGVHHAAAQYEGRRITLGFECVEVRDAG